jgi:hypothetical protein
MSQMSYLRRGGLLIAALALAGGAAAAASGAAQGAAHAGAAHAGATRQVGAARPTGAARQPGGASQTSTTMARALTAKAAAGTATAASTAGGAGKHASMLDGVSCAGTQCVAVGSWYDNPPIGHSLAERWNGASWQRQASPDGPTDSFLTGVSCAAVTHAAPDAIDCLAVGNLVLAEATGSWRLVAKTSNLDAVSCAKAGDCVAVGAKPTGAVPLFATWNGKTLRTGRMHAAPHTAQTVTVAGVSCVAANDCVAVGDYSYGVGAKPGPGARDRTLAEQWNGSSWRVLPTVNVSDWNELSAVSCASADNCTAVGSSESQFALAEHWNGKTWRVEPVPSLTNPAKIGYLQLTGVSCPAAKFCVATGSSNGAIPLAETWNGTKWRLARLPLRANQSASLSGVACASTAACVAVGTGPTANAWAEVYAHGVWKQSAAKNPA